MFVLSKVVNKKPIMNRFFACAVFLCMSATCWDVWAQESSTVLTEEDVVRLVRGREDRAKMRGAQVQEIEASAQVAEALSNPGLNYTREQILTQSQRLGEDYVVLSQQVPVSGRARLQGDVLRAQARAERRRVELATVADIVRAQGYFYQALLFQERIEVRELWLKDVERLEQLIQFRIDVGESSLYELERFKREVADVEVEIGLDRNRLLKYKVLLVGELRSDITYTEVVARGDLLPAPPPGEEEIDRLLMEHPMLKAVEEEAQAIELQHDVVGRWWIPEPTLSLGYKGSGRGDGRAHGFVVGFGMSLPLLNKRKGERAATDARAVYVKNLEEIEAQGLRVRSQALAMQLGSSLELIERYEEEGLAQARGVLELATQAYVGGEVGIVELLDAHQGVIHARLTLLELSAHARELRNQLYECLGGNEL